MKATVSHKSFATALSAAARGVSPRSTLPVLANVLIEADENSNTVTVKGTNLECEIAMTVAADVETSGGITVPARIVTDLAKTYYEDVYLNTNPSGTQLSMASGSNGTDFRGIPAEEFPVARKSAKAGVEIGSQAFETLMTKVVYAASRDESRPVLMGIYIEFKDGHIYATATDGFRIAMDKMPFENSEDIPGRMIVPAKNISEVIRIAKTIGAETISLKLSDAGNAILFEMDGAVITSQIIEGTYPDYRAILSGFCNATPHNIVLSTTALTLAARQVDVIARENAGTVYLKPSMVDDKPILTMTAQSKETGEAAADIELSPETNVDAMEPWALNNAFLQETVTSMGATTEIVMRVISPNKPIMITRPGNEDIEKATALLMPMHMG